MTTWLRRDGSSTRRQTESNPIAPDRLALFLREIEYVVTAPIKPDALRAYLEKQKPWLRGDETIDDWYTVLTVELNRLRLEDALQRNIRPEVYRA